MSQTEIGASGIKPPRMAAVDALPAMTLRVKWAEGRRAGRKDLVDVRPILYGDKIYKPLRDEARFATGRLADDGGAVAWDGDGLEMSADMIQSAAEQAMTPADFSRFMARNALTQDAAAAVLGRSRRQIANYTSAGPIPRIVALACYGFEAHRREAAKANLQAVPVSLEIEQEVPASAEIQQVPASPDVPQEALASPEIEQEPPASVQVQQPVARIKARTRIRGWGYLGR